MFSQGQGNEKAPPTVEDLVALARPTMDASWLTGSLVEESAEEGERIIRAIQGIAQDPNTLQQWRMLSTMNQEAAATIKGEDSAFDETLWDESADLLLDWHGLVASLKVRWEQWFEAQRQTLQAGLATVAQPHWTPRSLPTTIPFAFVRHATPQLGPKGVAFHLETQETYSLQLVLPAPHHVALLQLDEDPTQPPALLFPKNQAQSKALGTGGVELLQLRFPEAGETQLVLLFAETPFEEVIEGWPADNPEQANWSEEQGDTIAEGLLQQVDGWSPQLLVLSVAS